MESVTMKLEKKPTNILLTSDFQLELKFLNKLLLKTQGQRRGILNLKIPYPFSVGDELEFRYKKFNEQLIFCKELIHEFIPIDQQKVYLNKLEYSPIQLLMQNIDQAIITEVSLLVTTYKDTIAVGPQSVFFVKRKQNNIMK